MSKALSSILIAAFVAFGSSVANATLIPFRINLSGANEVAPGDADGSGVALLIFDSASNSLHWNISLSNVALPLSAANIHAGLPGVQGPVVIDFAAALSGSLTDPDVASVLADPVAFYVNIHNPSFPAGAVRGQLQIVVPIPFSAALSGSQEVSPGDPDGVGVALVNIDSGTNQVNWVIALENVDMPLTAANIHAGLPGVQGPVVIDFAASLNGSVVDADAASVLANPTGFYVNIHSDDFPAGAVRGQLVGPGVTAVAEPTSLALLALGLAGFLVGQRRQWRFAR